MIVNDRNTIYENTWARGDSQQKRNLKSLFKETSKKQMNIWEKDNGGGGNKP